MIVAMPGSGGDEYHEHLTMLVARLHGFLCARECDVCESSGSAILFTADVDINYVTAITKELGQLFFASLTAWNGIISRARVRGALQVSPTHTLKCKFLTKMTVLPFNLAAPNGFFMSGRSFFTCGSCHLKFCVDCISLDCSSRAAYLASISLGGAPTPALLDPASSLRLWPASV
eukprot:scaffold830_cov377-Prasinococcus_capsulatus_cf.AAC.17